MWLSLRHNTALTTLHLRGTDVLLLLLTPMTTTTPTLGFEIVNDRKSMKIELGAMLVRACRAANIPVRRPGGSDDGADCWIPIVVGRSPCNHLSDKTFVLWQLDQPKSESRQQLATVKRALRSWELSEYAVKARAPDNAHVVHLPFPYHGRNLDDNDAHQALWCDRERDVDVCMLGAMSKRRTVVAERLRALGLNVFVSNRCWRGAKRAVLERAKIVVNVHFYRSSAQEIQRILESLDAGAFVVSERSLSPETDALFEGESVRFAPRVDDDSDVARCTDAVVDTVTALLDAMRGTNDDDDDSPDKNRVQRAGAAHARALLQRHQRDAVRALQREQTLLADLVSKSN